MPRIREPTWQRALSALGRVSQERARKKLITLLQEAFKTGEDFAEVVWGEASTTHTATLILSRVNLPSAQITLPAGPRREALQALILFGATCELLGYNLLSLSRKQRQRLRTIINNCQVATQQLLTRAWPQLTLRDREIIARDWHDSLGRDVAEEWDRVLVGARGVAITSLAFHFLDWDTRLATFIEDAGYTLDLVAVGVGDLDGQRGKFGFLVQVKSARDHYAQVINQDTRPAGIDEKTWTRLVKMWDLADNRYGDLGIRFVPIYVEVGKTPRGQSPNDIYPRAQKLSEAIIRAFSEPGERVSDT